LILLECVFAESIEFARVGVSPAFFNTIRHERKFAASQIPDLLLTIEISGSTLQ
jgi:hypothetical protein